MVNWSTPTLSTAYATVLTNLHDKDVDTAKMFDGSSSTNIPTGSIRINSSASNALGKYNGATWDNIGLSVTTLTASGAVATGALTVTGLATVSGNVVANADSTRDLGTTGVRWRALYVDSIVVGGNVDGRNVSVDGAKLDNIEANATIDQTDSEIETAYNAQVSIVSQAEAEAGTATTVRRWTAQRVKQAISALSTTAGGANTQVQFNNSGTLAGNSAFTFDSGTGAVTATTFIGDLTIDSYSEDADSYTVTSGTKTLNLANATYFYASGSMTAVAYTFAFSNPAASGRVTSFVIELRNAIAASSITWPAAVDWGLVGEPDWTSGVDCVALWTRDAGTTWHGVASITASS